MSQSIAGVLTWALIIVAIATALAGIAAAFDFKHENRTHLWIIKIQGGLTALTSLAIAVPVMYIPSLIQPLKMPLNCITLTFGALGAAACIFFNTKKNAEATIAALGMATWTINLYIGFAGMAGSWNSFVLTGLFTTLSLCQLPIAICYVQVMRRSSRT